MTDETARLEQQIIALRKQLVEARRQSTPVGPYSFKTLDDRAIGLTDLFGDMHDLIVIHNMGSSCPYCTLWADGFNGVADHLQDRSAFVLCSPDEPAKAAEFAQQRQWRFPVVCLGQSSFARDMGYEPEPGSYWPGVSAFNKRDDGTIVRTGTASFGPGDEFCSAWHLFDLLQDGPDEWSPRYSYGPRETSAT